MFRKRMSEALREAREYRDPTCPICEGEGCQCSQGEEINEGFKSDAQRRAAFASGYKAKGKKGKKEEIEKDGKTATGQKPTKVEIEPEVK